ncbi:MAG: hypothetical protein ACYDHN_08310 [Solirubrobacteraceae bacterium]
MADTPTVAERPLAEEEAGGPGRPATREAPEAREAPPEAPVARRTMPARRRRRRSRDAGAAAVGAVGSGVVLIARLVMAVAGLIALLIALAIVLRDVDANRSNTIVKWIHEGANFFAGAFTGLISFSGHPKRAITVDWGIALIAYLLVGSVIAGYIARIGRGGLRFERAHSSAFR